jgi:two-component system alkaline phosphatase synthesis response regulator PhoP
MSGRILIVEDEAPLAMVLRDRLRHEGYVADIASDGQQGLELALQPHFDLVILDVMLPNRSGFDICREVRAHGLAVPILILTARSEITDRVTGLKLGADDYLAKPFDVSELLARMEALLRRARRAPQPSAADQFQYDELTVDFDRKLVMRGGNKVELSAKEFHLLKYLISKQGTPVGRDELLENVWGYRAFSNTRTVDVHVAQLRQKVEDNPRESKYILTVHGFGYKFQGPERMVTGLQ